MKQDRRDVFRKIGMLGATALALVGVSKPAKADEAAASNPLVGLWDMTIPGSPTLYYKYAISEGAYVCTGNLDGTAVPFGFKYSPTMGTYVRTGHNSYQLRERSWAMDASGNPAGYSDFTGTAVVTADGKSFSGSGTYVQYDLNGNVVFNEPITYTAVKFPPVPHNS
jgi:hypothetical protein